MTITDFATAHPELAGYTPGCGHCQFKDATYPGALTCRVTDDARVRMDNDDCDQTLPDGTPAFMYDARPLWEQYPNAYPREWWEQGEKYGTAFKLRLAAKHAKDRGDTPMTLGGLAFIPTPGVPLHNPDQ